MSKELHSNICDKRIFSKVYNKYAEDIYNFLYYKYGESMGPNDKMQDAFIKLWENCKKVTLETAKSYLFTVANNMMLNEVKHQKVVLKHQQIKPKDYTNENPEFLFEKEEYLLKYQNALSKLTEDQRVAFSLSKIEGKKYKEIAELLGVTVKVIEYRVLTAFKILKGELNNFKLK